MTVSLGIACRAFASDGYREAKSLSLRERKCTCPPVLNAMARYPSNLISYRRSLLSGSFSILRRSIGSTKRAFSLSDIVTGYAMLGLDNADALRGHCSWCMMRIEGVGVD